MKWIGSILLIATGLGTGLAGWLRLQRRVNALQQFLLFINRLSERIRYTTAPLSVLLQALSKTDEFKDFPLLQISFQGAGREMRRYWQDAIEEQGESWGFSADDRVLVKAFTGELGKTDAAGEVRFCEDYETLTRSRLEQAREDWKSKGRLYLTLGACGGIAAALLLW